MRLNKPIGAYLLLWPTLTGLWLASNGFPSLKLFIIFSLGVLLTRSAGCVINDYADREFDKHVERTKYRPLTTGQISKNSALLLFTLLLLVAFALVLQTNTLTVLLSLGAVILMSVYPFMKRFIHAPQLILGLAFSWAIPMVFAAQTGSVPLSSLWIMGYVVSWAVVYDTMYAMDDKEDDLKVGIKSTAILFAPREKLWIGFFQLIMLFCLVMTGNIFDLAWPFFLGLGMVASMIIVQHRKTKQGNTDNYFTAFLQNHWQGFIVMVATLASLLA